MRQRGEIPGEADPGVEGAILRSALEESSHGWLLDIGSGTGRLQPILQSLATNYIGLDQDVRVLRNSPLIADSNSRISFVRANAQQPPFRDAIFLTFCMIR